MGGWVAQGHIMWRVAKAGKMGYHARVEHNKWLVKIGNANEINKKGFEEPTEIQEKVLSRVLL